MVWKKHGHLLITAIVEIMIGNRMEIFQNRQLAEMSPALVLEGKVQD